MKKRLCVVGNGMAGIKAVEKVLQYAPNYYEITMLSEETHPAYNRILLSSLLSGDMDLTEVITHDDTWYQNKKVSLLKNFTVVSGDLKSKILHASDGRFVEYDELLIATGSSAIKIPFPGADLPQVITFRDINDVDVMLHASKELRSAAVVGGGLLGLEAAYGLMRRGMNVTVIHLLDSLMERQLDYESGKLLEEQLIAKGLTIKTGKQTEEILGSKEGKVTGIRFKDGEQISCEIVVMAVGIKPRVDLAKNLGLDVNRGIKINEYLETSEQNVWSLGECVEFGGQTFGLVAPLYDMADVFAKNILAKEKISYSVRDVPTKLKVSGVNLYSHGIINPEDGDEELVFRDSKSGVYRKLIIRDDFVKGIVLLGNTNHSNWYTQLFNEQSNITSFREQILFGPPSDGAVKGVDVASMPDQAEVCGCNGVSKKFIVSAIQERGLTSLAEVKLCTKAGTGCGSCGDLVQDIISHVTGGEPGKAIAREKEGICPCTSYDHEDIRVQIKAKNYQSMPELMSDLSWKTTDGCHRCRPALNYYLLCANPRSYQDDRRSRFVNERVHANIQKDGTYSVIPRMFGGLTNIKELRAIADVAEEFNIPTIKVTGGQRIDLLGVAKEDLPTVWERLNDAGMVSGHAYGKAVRTVKTCVGSEWCRFGTQDSTKMGVDLEKALWGSWTPHKFKLAVSGCPRNCAESTIKDVGVIAVESGWEIHVGGNGGTKVRVTDFLCKVETDQEVMEYTCAFLQLYREEAKYLDRTSHWIEKVGLQYVKDNIVEDEQKRKELYQRFLISQEGNQIDPWKELPESEYASEEFKVQKIKGTK